MIASLRGLLLQKGLDHVILDVGGVGFRVLVPRFVLDQIGSVGHELTLVTHLHVREEELSLYGFATEEDKDLFELLLTVSGIGPRTAMGALSALPQDALRQALGNEDIDTLTRIPGIGRKTAQRLVLDLKDKVGRVATEAAPSFAGLTVAEAEVMAGLTSLGYSVAEAREAVRALPDERLSVEEQVLLALRYLGGGTAPG